MDHLEAKGMHAAEKYVLGELSEELREEYEEHYLDCTECAMDVRTAVAFVANSKEIFGEEAKAVSPSREGRPQGRGWAAWWKPLIAIPVIAALIVALIYEKHHSEIPIPTASRTEQTIVASNSFVLRAGDRDATESSNVQVHAGEPFGLQFDFTPGQTFEQYAAELQDQSGHALQQFSIPAERINKEVKVLVRGGLAAPGNYALVIYGNTSGQNPASNVVVARYLFGIEIIP
jgi:hypothetical protein